MWELEKSANSVLSYSVRFGQLQLRVHRHELHESDQWFVSCGGTPFENRPLTAREFDAAQAEAVRSVIAYLREHVAWLRDVPIKRAPILPRKRPKLAATEILACCAEHRNRCYAREHGRVVYLEGPTGARAYQFRCAVCAKLRATFDPPIADIG